MNDLFMTFISRLKVDAKCVYQQWNWITVVNYFGTPPADWVHGYLYFEPGAWLWTKGFRRYLHIVKNWSGKFPLNSPRVRALGWPLLGIFSRFFWFFLGGSVGQIICREYIVFRGSNISCSLVCSEGKDTRYTWMAAERPPSSGWAAERQPHSDWSKWPHVSITWLLWTFVWFYCMSFFRRFVIFSQKCVFEYAFCTHEGFA